MRIQRVKCYEDTIRLSKKLDLLANPRHPSELKNYERQGTREREVES